MTLPTIPNWVSLLATKFSNSVGLPFQESLPKTVIFIVCKEIYVYLLNYNLLRIVMWQAGTT